MTLASPLEFLLAFFITFIVGLLTPILVNAYANWKCRQNVVAN